MGFGLGCRVCVCVGGMGCFWKAAEIRMAHMLLSTAGFGLFSWVYGKTWGSGELEEDYVHESFD